MVILIIALPFLLVATSLLRWTRVAQSLSYRQGSVGELKRELVAPGSQDRLFYLFLTGAAIVGMIIWPLAFVAAAMWFLWPRSIPVRDDKSPIEWDSSARRFFGVSLAMLFLFFFGLYTVTIFTGLYALSLLPLLTVTVVEVTIKVLGSRIQAA